MEVQFASFVSAASVCEPIKGLQLAGGASYLSQSVALYPLSTTIIAAHILPPSARLSSHPQDLLELGQDVVALHEPLLLLLLHLAGLHAVQPGELLGDVIGALGLHLLDVGLLLVVAALAVLSVALHLDALGVRLEGVQVAAAVVRVALVVGLRREVLDGRVARDAVVAAELGLDSAVDIADDDRRGARERLGQVV